ncbi:MAG: DNA-binding response regulator, partial [Polaromonas sp.]|nr:DNA-binding response regulator [Polaromonas sp.]
FDLRLDSATRPGQGLALLRASAYDAAILDVMLPEMDGFALCREIRKESDIPIIMLTARGELTDRVVGLELGADDYLPKPFEPRELVARLQTLLRRRSAPVALAAADSDKVHGALRAFQGLSINLDTREVLRQGQAIELTGTEFELLALLSAEPGKVFSRDDILNSLRGHEVDLYTRAVDIVVSRLRKKLEPLDCIKTLRNAGYALAVARMGAP